MEDSSKQAYKWKKKVGGWGEWVDILILPSEIRGGWQPQQEPSECSHTTILMIWLATEHIISNKEDFSEIILLRNMDFPVTQRTITLE